MVGQCEGCYQRGMPKRKWLDSVRDAIREECLKENGWCDDVDNGLDNSCEVIRQETVLFSTPETDYIIYD